MKKWLSMFLAAVMLCGVLAGCGGTQSGSTPASGAQSASAAGDSNVNAEGFPIVNEPITLRGMVALNANVKDWNEHPALKRMEEAEQSLAAVESYYEGLDVTPKFYSKPDSVTLEERRAFFEAHGYAVHTFECQRMMLLTHTSPELLVHKCPVQIFAGAPLTGAAAQLVTESCGEKDFGLRLIDKQLGAGARVSFAYNRAEIPVSFCVGEGYGSAFYLSDVYTAENFRGQGYAAAAVLAMLGFARNPDMGYTDVFLYADDPAAIRLYEKLGFRGTPVREYRAFKGGLPDLYTEAKE